MSRHTSDMIHEARELHGAGFSCYRIALIFRRRGVPVDETTIATYVDPARAEARRQYNREHKRRINAKRSKGRLGAGPPRSPEFRLARMESLRDLGVSCAAIAKVMTFDFPASPLTEHQVRYSLATGSVPRSMREKAGV